MWNKLVVLFSLIAIMVGSACTFLLYRGFTSFTHDEKQTQKINPGGINETREVSTVTYVDTDLAGITNWVVVTNYPARGNLFQVLVRGSSSTGTSFRAGGFSGKEIPIGTSVKFVVGTHKVMYPSSLEYFTHFVEPR